MVQEQLVVPRSVWRLEQGLVFIPINPKHLSVSFLVRSGFFRMVLKYLNLRLKQGTPYVSKAFAKFIFFVRYNT